MLRNLCFVLFLVCVHYSSAYTVTNFPTVPLSATFVRGATTSRTTTASTTVAPPETETDRKTRRKQRDSSDGDDQTYDESDIRKQGPLEYLEDDLEQSRDLNDPFHILLLGETYLKPKVTINYVSGSLQFVLEMPYEDAVDAAAFAKDNGISCLGTWSREECLSFGKELQQRDLVVRVVPFVPGGQRGWQANKDAGGEFGNDDFIDADYRIESS